MCLPFPVSCDMWLDMYIFKLKALIHFCPFYNIRYKISIKIVKYVVKYYEVDNKIALR